MQGGARRNVTYSDVLEQDYQRLLGSQPTRRLNPSKIAESSVIKNKLVDTIAFLENLSVKVRQCSEHRRALLREHQPKNATGMCSFASTLSARSW